MTENEKNDERLVSSLRAYQNFLLRHHQASERLKKGYLKLAAAKLNLPAHALSEISYKEYFSAFFTISNNSIDKASSSESPKASDISFRRSPVPAETSEPKPDDSNQDPIMWFSSLPPQELRRAQNDFKKALEDFIDASTLLAQIQN